jgi:hypothetical protein
LDFGGVWVVWMWCMGCVTVHSESLLGGSHCRAESTRLTQLGLRACCVDVLGGPCLAFLWRAVEFGTTTERQKACLQKDSSSKVSVPFPMRCHAPFRGVGGFGPQHQNLNENVSKRTQCCIHYTRPLSHCVEKPSACRLLLACWYCSVVSLLVVV